MFYAEECGWTHRQSKSQGEIINDAFYVEHNNSPFPCTALKKDHIEAAILVKIFCEYCKAFAVAKHIEVVFEIGFLWAVVMVYSLLSQMLSCGFIKVSCKKI